MKKIRALVVSDNHGDLSGIEQALNKYYDLDYYLHLGDSCVPEAYLKPFISILGNNDYGLDYPEERVVEIGGVNFLMRHGSYNPDTLVRWAKNRDCKYILCGHTHMFTDEIVDGIRILNPGSISYNRDYSLPCYAILSVDEDKNVEFERINLDF